jgi:hypothetical protein
MELVESGMMRRGHLMSEHGLSLSETIFYTPNNYPFHMAEEATKCEFEFFLRQIKNPREEILPFNPSLPLREELQRIANQKCHCNETIQTSSQSGESNA